MMKMTDAIENKMNFGDLYSFRLAKATSYEIVIINVKLKKKKNILSMFVVKLLIFQSYGKLYVLAERVYKIKEKYIVIHHSLNPKNHYPFSLFQLIVLPAFLNHNYKYNQQV